MYPSTLSYSHLYWFNHVRFVFSLSSLSQSFIDQINSMSSLSQSIGFYSKYISSSILCGMWSSSTYFNQYHQVFLSLSLFLSWWIVSRLIRYWARKVSLRLTGYCLCLMGIYYLQTTILSSVIVPRFTEYLREDQFHPQIDIRRLNLLNAIELAKRWISTNVTIEVSDLFIGFLRFYALDFE